MCSNMRGPAILPSLVTWPIIITGTPCSLAKRSKRAVHSRTWPTLPGVESSTSVNIVWIESMTSKAGLCWLASCKIASKLVSAITDNSLPWIPRRSALSFNCICDSSPDAYSTLPCVSAIRPDTCSKIVDLPIPGSPPNKISAPGTIPPPKTRSISP